MITLELTEQQTNIVLLGLQEMKLGVSFETFSAIQTQIMRQRQVQPSSAKDHPE